MVDKSPDSLHDNPKKKNNPFKKILDDVKKFIKKDDEKDKKPSSFEAPKKGKKEEAKKPSSFEATKKEKKEEDKKSHSFEVSKKEKREKDKKPSSFKETKREKDPELDQQPENSSIPKIETPETKEAERSMRERKAKVKEQKLPKKYRKGW
jgi:hypothetical protein